MGHNRKANREQQKREGLSLLISFVTLIVSLASLIISVVALGYGIIYNNVSDNLNSYFEPLDYHIDLKNDGYIPKISKTNGNLEINAPDITVVSDTGGIRNASLIFFSDNQIYSILFPEDKNFFKNDREKIKASSLGATFEGVRFQVIKRHEAGDLAKKNGFHESYFATIYIAVEDYNRNYYLTAMAFEFPINGDGSLAAMEGTIHREFNDRDLLYANGDRPSNKHLTDYEASVIKDYHNLKTLLKAEGFQIKPNMN